MRLRQEGKHITAELMEEPRYISKIYKTDKKGKSLAMSIKPDVLKIIESEEGEWHLPDALTVWSTGREHRSSVMILSPETIEKNNLREGDQLEQFIHGRNLAVKLVPRGEEFNLTKLTEIYSPGPHSMRLLIPIGIRNKLDKEIWKKDSTVGFEINQNGRLAIIPEQYLKNAVKEKVTKYFFVDKEQFYYLVRRNYYGDEQKALKKVGRVIEDEGYITRKELKEIFKKHAPECSEDRLYTILKYLFDAGCLKREIGPVEKTDKKQP